MKRRRRIIQIVIAVFIGINFLLIFADEEARVDRISYIKDWSDAFLADVREQHHTTVEFAFEDEEHIYFDTSEGSFQEFLIEEEEDISVGDPLFSYQVDNYYEAEADLMQEIEKLDGEIPAIEQAISEMNAFQIPDSTQPTDPNPAFQMTEEEIYIEFPQDDPVEAEVMKQQFIIDKENELAQKQAALQSTQNQLTELQTTGDTITVESPYDGKVKNIATDLGDPIVTIELPILEARGELTELERNEIEEGFPALVELTNIQTFLDGTVSNLNDYPETVSDEGESIYSFQIAFEEEVQPEMENILPGYHADASITLNESLEATVIFDHLLTGSAVWKMTESGRLVEQPVETGILMDSMLEITDGVQPEELIAEESVNQFRDGAAFITPLKLTRPTWREITLGGNPNWSEYFVTGILSR
ncbi:efflux RND transporter periplasmic adaptor subunit [Virgibacillus oceani]